MYLQLSPRGESVRVKEHEENSTRTMEGSEYPTVNFAKISFAETHSSEVHFLCLIALTLTYKSSQNTSLSLCQNGFLQFRAKNQQSRLPGRCGASNTKWTVHPGFYLPLQDDARREQTAIADQVVSKESLGAEPDQ